MPVNTHRLRFHVSPLRLETEGGRILASLGMGGSYSGVFHSLSFANNVLPGTVFREDGLVTGVYVNTSNVGLYMRARIIDLAKSFPYNIISEEPTIYWIPPYPGYGGKMFSLPPWGVPGGATAGPMPDHDWTLQLQLLGYV